FRRTGTKSFQGALEILGLSPCYHMHEALNAGVSHIDMWENVHRGINLTENLHKILKDFNSGCDDPIACYPGAMLAAYPNAKFVLNVRPVADWKRSVTTTILPASTTLLYLPSFIWPKGWRVYSWLQEILWGPTGQFEGRFHELAERKFEEHIERVNRVIPPEQLLIYHVGEGWEKLCEFLDIPIPEQPYPHSNESGTHWDSISNTVPGPMVQLVTIPGKLFAWFRGNQKQKRT
ncbi:hypothetical protein DL96DRAFT_1472468, partial [Flagelloscypha sp. PMI_526]